jgi:hypothetical protein
MITQAITITQAKKTIIDQMTSQNVNELASTVAPFRGLGPNLLLPGAFTLCG